MNVPEQDLDKILKDKSSGSTHLLSKVHKLIRKYSNSTESILFILKAVKKQYPEFAILNEYSKRIELLLHNDDTSALINFLHNYEQSQTENILKIYYKNENILKDINSVVTLSNSKTVETVLCLMSERNILSKVCIAESRPKLEGRKLARKLCLKGINVELFADFSAAMYIKQCDAVIIGSDSVLVNGNVINKTGSLVLSILAKENRIPFYALAAKDKFLALETLLLSAKPSPELWKFEHPKLKIRNHHFEIIDSNYITKILTE